MPSSLPPDSFYGFAFLFCLVPIAVVVAVLWPYSHYGRGAAPPVALIVVILVSLACGAAFGYLGSKDMANNEEQAAWIAVSLGTAGAALPIAALFILVITWVLISYRGPDRTVSLVFGRPA